MQIHPKAICLRKDGQWMGKIYAEAYSMVTVNLLTIIFPMNLQYLFWIFFEESNLSSAKTRISWDI